MWNTSEQQDRVYGVLDVVTKPVQWLIGGVKMLFLLLIVAGVCIVAPIYYFLHGGGFASFEFELGCWVLGFLIMLFGAPAYTFIWGAVIFCSLFFWNINATESSGNLFMAVLWLYEGVGLTWVGAKILMWAERRWDRKAQEAAEEEHTRKAQEAAERSYRRERASTLSENAEILDSVAELISSTGSQAAEMMRAAKALKGAELGSTESVVLADISEILVRLANAGGGRLRAAARLFHGLRLRINPRIQDTVADTEEMLSCVTTSGDLTPPGMVLLLDMYDALQGTDFAAKAATTYLSLVSAAATLCGDSLALRLVTEAYAELLRPYLLKSSGDGNTGQSNCSSRSKCEKCVTGYQVLDLPYGAGADAVKAKKKAFAEFLHPDHLSGKSQRARLAAEEQLKRVNQACDHILQCIAE